MLNPWIKFVSFAVLMLVAVAVMAQPPGMPPRGMNMDDRDEMMSGPGASYGYGYGYGYGDHMGSMRHGYGMGGPGMDGPMMGMMDMGPFLADLRELNLNKDQQDKIRKLQRAVRKEHLALMEKNMDVTDKLQDMYAEETPDVAKIGAVYGEMFNLRRQMIESQIKLRNDVFALLSKEQQEKARNSMPYYGRHHRMMDW